MAHTLHTTASFGNSLIVTGQWDYEHKPELRSYLESEELSVLAQKIGQDVIIVLGGDGAMLTAIDAFRERDLPFFGINFGTIGYLMHPRQILADAQQFETTIHPLLKAQITAGDIVTDHYAFGDIYMTPVRGGGMCMYDVSVSQSNASKIGVTDVLGSGIIVSTPAGSTGFSGNLGADILSLESDQFVLTHIAPPRARHLSPVQIPSTDEISIVAKQLVRRPVLVYTDGRVIHESGSGDLSITVRKAQKSVKILIADTHHDTWHTRSLRDDGYSLL